MATISASGAAAKAQAELVAKNAAIAAKAAADVAAAIASVNKKNTGTSATEEFEAINEQVAQAIEQAKIDQSGRVANFEKETHDVTIDNNMTARDIGILRKNDSRLNLFSALTKGDQVDVFKFRVTNTAFTKLGTLIADPEMKDLVRIQIFSKTSGVLIADQNPDSGDSYQSFKKLEAGTLELAQGDYVVRVSRMPGRDSTAQTEVQYAIQLTQGVYRNDYDTVEKGTSSSQDAFGFANSLGAGTDALVSGLSAASSFISNLPAIGTTATSKLTGALYDALF